MDEFDAFEFSYSHSHEKCGREDGMEEIKRKGYDLAENQRRISSLVEWESRGLEY